MVRVNDLIKIFLAEGRTIRACNRVSFQVAAGEFFTLLGPSGCGKTTTLRCIAGLERPEGGEIELAGVLVFAGTGRVHVPPHRRDIGMVFQSYAIWPHMTVFENVAFPLQVGPRRVPAATVRERVRQTLAAVRLDGLERRPAVNLSGGQQQRLALARALVRQPKLLLLDEPLSNLDAKLREQMRWELRELQRTLGITMLYVTHDQVEALSMSDRVAVMHQGQIVQVGAPREIYERPGTPFVADFVGSTNLLRGVVVAAPLEPPWWRVETAGGPLRCLMTVPAQPGTAVLVSIRPEDVFVRNGEADPGAWVGVLEEVIFLGGVVDCRIRVRDLVLRAHAHPSQVFRPGDRVHLQFNPERLIAVRSQDGALA